MHPLVSKIHPSYRAAFVAWLIARTAIWAGTQARLGRVFGDPSVAVGTPLYRFLCDAIDFSGVTWAPAAFAALGELLLLAGAVAVYRFARRDAIPQTAERAVWFWALSPAMICATPGSDWTFAIALTALAFGTLGHLVGSSLLLAAAVAFRAEAVVVFPGLVWLWWRTRSRDADPAWSLIALSFAPAVFAATVLGGLLFADPGEMLAPTLRWRHDLGFASLGEAATEALFLAPLLAAALVAVRTTDRSNRAWLLVTIPVLLFAAITLPPVAGIALVPLAVPFFAQLGRFAQDPGVERAILCASLVALILGAGL